MDIRFYGLEKYLQFMVSRILFINQHRKMQRKYVFHWRFEFLILSNHKIHKNWYHTMNSTLIVRCLFQIQPDCLFQLLLALGKDCPDNLSVLDLAQVEMPLKALVSNL